MSLLDEYMEAFVRVSRATTDDGYGSVKTTYSESKPFRAALSVDVSSETTIGFRDGLSNSCTLLTDKKNILNFHDIVKRVRDGKIYRVTSNGDDRVTPKSSPLGLSAVTCEEWELTDG